MNAKALAELGQHAGAWAKAYVQVKEALTREGVRDEEAREAATNAANMAALWDSRSGEPCPLCGRET